MEYKDAIDMIKNIDNDRYRNYKKADFIEDFIMTKEKYSLSNILSVADEDEDGRTIAHVMVSNGYIFNPDIHRNILLLADKDGWTVAHHMALNGYRFNPDKHRNILLLAYKNGWTVAHQMALEGFNFDPDRHKDILMLATKKDGWTVAHWMAWNGYKFDIKKHIDILLLEDKEGKTVAEIQGLSEEEIKYLKQKYQKDIKGAITNGV